MSAELHARWVTDPASLSGHDLIDVYRYATEFNENVKRGDPGLDVPRLEDIVLAFHPNIICGETGTSPEWYVLKGNLYEPVPSIKALLGRVLQRLDIPTSGWTNLTTDLMNSLASRVGIRELSILPMRLDLKARRAIQFEKETGVVGVVACATKLLLLRSDGTYAEEPYGPTTFVLNRLPADPNPAVLPTRTEAWVVERLGEDQARAYWEWASYCLSPKNTYKRIHLWLGPTDSGKSTGVRLLTKILGEHNVAHYAAKQLIRPFILAELRGKLLNVGEEDPGYGHEFEALLKTISGGTPISWEIKFGASGSSLPTFKCLFTSNNPATFVDSSGAYARRMVVLRWGVVGEDTEATTSIPLAQQRPMSEFDRMFEEELPGILAKLLALRAEIVLRNDVHVPEQSRKLVEEIAVESNSVALWCEENVVLDPSVEHHKDTIYEDYKKWCEFGNNTPYTHQVFWRKMRQLPDWRKGKMQPKRGPRDEGRPRLVVGMSLPQDRAKGITIVTDKELKKEKDYASEAEEAEDIRLRCNHKFLPFEIAGPDQHLQALVEELGSEETAPIIPPAPQAGPSSGAS